MATPQSSRLTMSPRMHTSFLPSVYTSAGNCKRRDTPWRSQLVRCLTSYHSDILNAYTRNPSASVSNWTIVIVQSTRRSMKSSITELTSQPLDCHDHRQRCMDVSVLHHRLKWGVSSAPSIPPAWDMGSIVCSVHMTRLYGPFLWVISSGA